MKTKKELEYEVKKSVFWIAVAVALIVVHVGLFDTSKIFDWVILALNIFLACSYSFCLGGEIAALIFLDKQNDP